MKSSIRIEAGIELPEQVHSYQVHIEDEANSHIVACFRADP